MLNPKSTLLFAIFGAGLVGACGAEADLDDPLAREATAESGSEGAGDTGEGAEVENGEVAPSLPEDLALALEREAQAPGYAPVAYPAAPYGFVQGSTVPNFDFLGWGSPAATNFDLAQLSTIDLAAFYDPDGQKGIELLMINAVAVWCGVCQAEYIAFRDEGLYATYRPRGLEMLGVLFEDSNSGPAKYADLQNWTRVFEVNFPFVLDPGFKMGAFFDRTATPMNMVVDARSMQVLVAITGYNPEIFDFIDRELTARGR